MKQTRDDIMGMPITVHIADRQVDEMIFDEVFTSFMRVDRQYSTYKSDSEISQINDGLPVDQWSSEMKTVLTLCEETKQATGGFFDIRKGDRLDPSGLVKGWAIQKAAQLLMSRGYKNFYVDAGGDIEVSGHNSRQQPWQIGVRNPFNRDEIVKVLQLSAGGVATSGLYIRGPHIYNPHQPDAPIYDVAALTVVGPNIYEADRFATAAFAMGQKGLGFIESLDGYEGYMIDHDQRASYTSGFEKYVVAV